MSARPTSLPKTRTGRTLGWFAVAILVAIAMTVDAHGAFAQSESPAPEASAVPTPSPMATATPGPTPTLVPSPTPIPTSDLDHPPLKVTFVASTQFECDRRGPDGTCFVDVDDRGLTFTAEFDGAQVLSSDSYADRGFGIWSLVLPGTAIGIGPGGSVRAIVTAAPEDVFRVIDVDCFRAATPFEDELHLPSTLQGNGVVFEFDVAPDADDPTYDCRFAFDPARLPRFPSPPSTLPPTDTMGATAAGSDGPTRFPLLILAGLVAGVLALTTRRVFRAG